MNLKHAIILTLKPGDLRRVISELRLGDARRMDASAMTQRLVASPLATPQALLGGLSDAQLKQLARSRNLAVSEDRTALLSSLLENTSTPDSELDEETDGLDTEIGELGQTTPEVVEETQGEDSAPSPTRLIQALPFIENVSPKALESLLLRSGSAQTGSTLISAYVEDLRDRSAAHDFAEGLAELVWETVIEIPLVRLVPSIQSLEGIKVLREDTPARLFNLLTHHRASDWKRIARLKLRDVLEWPNAGKTTAIHLLALTIEQGLEALKRADAMSLPLLPTSDSSHAHAQAEMRLVDSVKEIVAWSSAEHSVSSLTEALALVRTASDLPTLVQAAWSELSRSMDELIAPRRKVYEVEPALGRVVAELEPRQLTILLSRPLAFRNQPTLEELGRELGLTRERVRQLEGKALTALDTALERPENQPLVRAGKRLASRLGAVARASEVGTLNADINGPTDSEALQQSLLLWIAGPYDLYGDWLVRSPADELVSQSLEKLEASLVDGFLDIDAAVQALDGLGIREDVRADWLKTLPGLAEHSGHIVRKGRSLADKAETVLRLRAEPMTKEAIASELGGDFNIRTLGNYLLTDRRFRRRGLSHFGLTEWGGEEYTTIVDEITEELERQGGEASIEYLVETLTTNFGVSENSVRSYASGPKFMRTGRGTIVTRNDPKPTAAGRPIELTRRCFRIDNAWALRVNVTSETLRGSGMPIPTGVAAHINLTHSESIVLSSPYGDVRFTWPSLQPAMGTIRAAAEALGAEPGDYLFVRLSPPEKAGFHVVHLNELEDAASERRLALEMGVDPDLARRDVLQFGYALGFVKGFTVHDVERRLALRDEEDLIALLPALSTATEDNPENDLERLTAVLKRITSREVGPISGNTSHGQDV